MSHRAKLEALLIEDEGYRRFPYEDSEGILSIGVGRNLEQRGLRDDEIRLMFANDVAEAEREIATQPWAIGHGIVRWAVLVSMVFNLGLPRLLGFKRMIAALERRDYATAAAEMLDSKWARQVGRRATRLAEMMRSGEWPDGL